MTINGMKIKVQKGPVFIDGQEWGPLAEDASAARPQITLPVDRTLEFDSDGRIEGDIYGDVYITNLRGGMVNLTVEGSIDGSAAVDIGNIKAQNIGGSSRAGGDVSSNNAGGSVKAGGHVKASMVGGSVKCCRTAEMKP